MASHIPNRLSSSKRTSFIVAICTYFFSGGLVGGTLLKNLSVGLGLLDLSLWFQGTEC